MNNNGMIVKPIKESMIAKVGFWQGLVVSLISVVTTVIVIGVLAGNALTRLTRVEDDMKEQKQAAVSDRANTLNQLQRIEDKIPNKEEFIELRKDVKDLIRQKR